ncbi:hypothetical protein FCULG_00008901 [Fusarium culmorum]|uniref:Uncharacterized protein n=1 Tax=Fusarium culmorum TaxID=5516 RepID=A0A2T4H461_FUSCU|nr:hypothetical protein FCULG_00008901 [Fusarium culmorum]
MKFSTVFTATLASYTLASPIIINSPDAITISNRGSSQDFAPRIGVTLPAVSKKVPPTVSDRIRRSSKTHDSVLKLMDFVATRVRADCQDINTSIMAVKYEGLKDVAVVTTVRTMNNIRTLLSKTVSQLDTTPNMVFTQEERQKLISDLHIFASEFFKTTEDYINTLGGASGGRSLSRTAHALTDVLESITVIDATVASDMSRKLTPIFSGRLDDDDDLLNVVVSPVTSFLSSIKLDDVTTACSTEDCVSDQNEELR